MNTQPTPRSITPNPAWTPGPWEMRDSFLFSKRTGQAIAELVYDEDVAQGYEEYSSNAALIQSAPEMAEALAWYGEQARLARLVHSGGDEGRNAIASDGGNKARALLARINGGNP